MRDQAVDLLLLLVGIVMVPRVELLLLRVVMIAMRLLLLLKEHLLLLRAGR